VKSYISVNNNTTFQNKMRCFDFEENTFGIKFDLVVGRGSAETELIENSAVANNAIKIYFETLV
jgi:hypothetical protein